jgi:hypothetical protein
MFTLIDGSLSSDSSLPKLLRLKSDDSYLLASLCAL